MGFQAEGRHELLGRSLHGNSAHLCQLAGVSRKEASGNYWAKKKALEGPSHTPPEEAAETASHVLGGKGLGVSQALCVPSPCRPADAMGTPAVKCVGSDSSRTDEVRGFPQRTLVVHTKGALLQ